MTRRLPIAIVLSVAVALAGAGLTAPGVGFTRDAAGDVCRVLGVRGNLFLDTPVATGALSATFWRGEGRVKTETALLTIDGAGAILRETPAPSGPAVVGLSAKGRSSVVWLSDHRVLWVQHGTASRPVYRAVQVGFDGEVIGAVDDGRTAVLLVRRHDGVWQLEVSKRSGQVQAESLIAHVREPVLLLPDRRLLYADGDVLVLRNAAGTENRLPVAAPVTGMDLAGSDTVHLQSTGASFLLHLNGLAGTLEFLPESRR